MGSVMSYLDCWDIIPEQFPEFGEKSAQIEFLLRYAILAPSNHNTQPWIFEVEGDEIRISADRTRSLPASDPDDRELIISCGVAMFFLETAARAFGFDVRTRRIPKPSDDNLIAEVIIGERKKEKVGRPDLLHAITRRRTNRGKFAAKPLEADIRDAIAGAASANGVHANWIQSKPDRAALANLISTADRQQFENRAFRRELANWVHANRTGEPDGIPAKSIGFEAPLNYVAPLLIRTFDIATEKVSFDEALVRLAAGFLILSTGFDQPLDWVRAGEALGGVLLTAESLGVNASYLNQACEIEELRSRLAAVGNSGGHPQIVLRLGYGLPVSPTPRRSLEAVMRVRLSA
jgi:hypothetical protein